MHQDLLDDDLTGGTQHWDQRTITKINDAKLEINESLKWVRQGRVVLWVLSGLSLVSILITQFYNPYGATESEIVIEGVVLCLLYLGLAIYFPRNPLLSLVVGFSIWLLVQVLSAFALPESLYRGIIVKAIIIVGLVRGIIGAWRIRKYGKVLREYGVPRREIDSVLRELKPIRKTPRRINIER